MMKLAYISFLLCHFLLVNYSHVASDQLRPFKPNTSIPALFVFGDSWVDNGNGKYMGNPNPSSAYGVDFKVDNQSRATNGKTMADFIAQTFGMPCLPPFLSLKKSESIQFGANYASSGCGILPDIKRYTFVNCMDLDEQIKLFKSSVENSRNSIDLSKSLIFINIGQNDMDLNKKLGYNASPDMGQYLAGPLSKRLQMLYDLGGRKFLVSNVLPLGCRPFSISQELNDCIYRLQYCIQHESISLTEEKQNLRDIKQLEGTRAKVIANAAMRAKIQDSMGQKEDIQDRVKLMGVDLDGVKKEQQVLWGKIDGLDGKVKALDAEISTLQDELTAVTQKRDKAYETIQELRKQRDEANANFYQCRMLLTKAKELAARKDVVALEELAHAEVEKFMSLWSHNKAFRDDYKKRILPSLDRRQLSKDGRIRNPGEKPLVMLEMPILSELEPVVKANAKQPKENPKPTPQKDAPPSQKVQKETTKTELKTTIEHSDIVDKEVSGLEILQKNSSAEKEVDEAKLKEMKREEEIAKAKQAMERKKKLAVKAAAKAAARAQKDAEKKLKEREKKLKKAAATVPEEPAEAVAEAAEPEMVEVNDEVPVPVKEKVRKENTLRPRNRPRGPDSLPKAISRRRKSTNYWVWAAPAALVVLLILALGYYYYIL